MVTKQLQQALESEIARCVSRARDLVLCEFSEPSFRLDLRGRIAGLALLKEHCIRLNIDMLLRYGNRFIDQVVAHELAHLLAFRRFGSSIRPHGREWKWIMREVFERQASVTHDFTVKLAHKKVVWYRCSCPEPREFSLTRHRRALAGTIYTCQVCRQTLIAVATTPQLESQSTPKRLPPRSAKGRATPWEDLLLLAQGYLEHGSLQSLPQSCANTERDPSPPLQKRLPL